MKLKDLSEYTDAELALCVWAGFLGDGVVRKSKLGTRYKSVQSLVDKQARTQLIEPIKAYDFEAVEKAVRETYDDAADELIDLIKKGVK